MSAPGRSAAMLQVRFLHRERRMLDLCAEHVDYPGACGVAVAKRTRHTSLRTFGLGRVKVSRQDDDFGDDSGDDDGSDDSFDDGSDDSVDDGSDDSVDDG